MENRTLDIPFFGGHEYPRWPNFVFLFPISRFNVIYRENAINPLAGAMRWASKLVLKD